MLQILAFIVVWAGLGLIGWIITDYTSNVVREGYWRHVFVILGPIGLLMGIIFVFFIWVDSWKL